MKIIDQDVREEILNFDGNIAITASAGTGKTYIIIEQIKKEYKEINDWRTFAAITFTRKAAKELEKRLPFKLDYGFIGTNDSFVFSEIINIFFADVYGKEFNKIQLVQDFNADNAILSFDDGLSKIKETGIICTYGRNMNGRLISGNFSFQLANKILEKSEAANLYLQAKFKKIFIDEYQDTDYDMHNLFKKLNALGIKLFVVGDSKQAIYRFRGGDAKYLKEFIENPNFKEYELLHNFRSNLQVQNYCNIMTEGQEYKYLHIELNGKIRYIKNFTSNYKGIINWANDDECCILVRRNDKASEFENEIQLLGGDFIYIKTPPIEDARYESRQVYISRNVTRFLIDDNYNEYKFCDEIFEECNVRKVRRHLIAIKKYFIENNYEEIIGVLKVIYKELGYEINDTISKEINAVIDTLKDSQYWNFYKADNFKHKIMTMHGSKGLQFEKVIVDCRDFNTDQLTNEWHDDFKLHYVAITRAKEEELILMNNDYFQYFKNKTIKININIAEEIN